jgi:integrase
MPKNLTKTAITNLRYEAKGPSRQALFDAKLPGFGVRVYKSGRKSYVLQYGPSQARRLMVLAPCTTGADVDEVREQAQTLLRRHERDGIDPLTDQKRQQSSTVGAVINNYIDAKATTWADREAPRCRSRLKNHIGEKLSAIPLNDLTRAQVREMHRRVSASAPYEANRTVQLLRAAINWAITDLDWPASELSGGNNPAHAIKLNQEKARKEWIRPNEIPALLKAIEAEPDPWIRAFFQLLLFTGGRLSELLTLRWRDVDLPNASVTFRDTKNKTDHTLPLAPDAADIIKSIPRTKGNPYVFNGHKRGSHLMNPYKAWRRVLDRAEIERRITIHDVRRTVGSLLASSGYSTQQIGKLLNHKSAITAKVYAEIADEAKAEMAEAMAGLLK